MNCMAHIVKYILFIFNIVFVICGILLITLGAIMLNNIGDFASFDEAANTQTIPIIIVILGSVIFIVAFFGCCGAIRENFCCITTYAVFMFILFCLQITLVVWIFERRQEFLNLMSKIVNIAWEENDNAHGYPMDVLQASFKCCGLHSYQDYKGNVPTSCCGQIRSSETCPADVYSTKPGCHDKFVDFWATTTNIIQYPGIGIALVELVAFIFACCLAMNIRKSRRYK